VVLNNLEAARREQSQEEIRAGSTDELLARIRALREDLTELERALDRTRPQARPSSSQAAAEAY